MSIEKSINVFHRMVEEIEDYAILLLDENGNVIDWNRGAEKLKGYKTEEIIGKNFRIFYTEEDRKNKVPEKLLQKAVLEGKATDEGWRVRKDKSRFWGSILITTLRGEDNKITGFSKITHDLTEKKLLEEKLKEINSELEQKVRERSADLEKSLKEISDYKYALNESSIVAITDQKGIINYANENFCKISKYGAEELIGQDHRIINSGYHSKEFIRNLWVTIANGNIWRGELRNKAKDGTIYWVDTTIVPFMNEQGKPYQYIAIRADITERKKFEETLKSSLLEVSNYKNAIDESTSVTITDEKGIIIYANDNFCRLSQHSREELIGQDHRIVNSGYHPKEFFHEFWETITHGKIWHGEIKNRAKDGSFYWVDATVVPFLNDQMKPFQYMAIRTNITERKKDEEEINRLNQELEERVKLRTEELEAFSYSVSHDLRAPLRAVNGYARVLEEDYDSVFDLEGKRLLMVIQENAMKMGRLIDDLLSFSRLGKKETVPTFINMDDLFASAWAEINKSAGTRARLIISPLHAIVADKTLIYQVAINLLSNASKYSAKVDNPVIKVESGVESGEVVYSVSDNGVGFDNKYVHKLFGVFQRLHSNEEFEGTGVGLALVKRIINKHGGRVWAKGEENKGATFYFSLPQTI